MSIQTNILPDNPQIEVIKSGKTGLFTNYIYKAIPLAFDESMSYYETLCGLLNYLKNVIIPTVNNNADAVAELQNLYEQLRSYVNDYFTNLDVQEEINNKLDKMVEDGTLPEIIASYLNSKAVFGFDNVESMKNATNLIDGSYAKTLGFYNKNDNGGAYYKIRNITNEGIIDNMTIIALNNEDLIAELIIDTNTNVYNFGAKNDETFDNTLILQNAINIMYEKKLPLIIPTGTFRTNGLILKCNLKGIENPIILFNNGQGFINYELDGSKRYDISKIENITFESDKSSYWNSENAGESYNNNVTKKDVIRKYGQRIYIGNKTSTPNNIHSTNENDTLDGTGFWNNDYSQWVNGDGINPDSISISYNAIEDKNDTNIITTPNGIIIDNCKFYGFSIGLTIKATYNSIIENSFFSRCKIGIVTDSGETLPGNLSDGNAKVTTLKVNNNSFTDIKLFGMYCKSLLQSLITNNIYQPVNIGNVLITCAENEISNNYNEIVYCGTLLATNDCIRNKISRNFVSKIYSTYNFYLKYGVYNIFEEPLASVKGYVAASTENNDFDEKCDLTKTSYFYINGNSIARNKTKYAVFKTIGTGSNITKELIKTNRPDNVLPSINVSGQGIYFNGLEEILNIECLNNGNNLVRYYDVGNTGNPNVAYLNKFNNDTHLFEELDVRTLNQTNVFRVTFNDGYKS